MSSACCGPPCSSLLFVHWPAPPLTQRLVPNVRLNLIHPSPIGDIAILSVSTGVGDEGRHPDPDLELPSFVVHLGVCAAATGFGRRPSPRPLHGSSSTPIDGQCRCPAQFDAWFVEWRASEPVTAPVSDAWMGIPNRTKYPAFADSPSAAGVRFEAKYRGIHALPPQ